MAWITTKSGKRINTDWFTKEYQIEHNKKLAEKLNGKVEKVDKLMKEKGIPSTMPTKEQLLAQIKKLKGKDLEDAISRLDSMGSFYREDKRQKRGYLQGVIDANYTDDPAQSRYSVGNDMEMNYKLISVVTGVSSYSNDFKKRFGRYDVDKLYERARKK